MTGDLPRGCPIDALASYCLLTTRSILAALMAEGVVTSKLFDAVLNQSLTKAQWIIEQLNCMSDNVELREGIIKQAGSLRELLQQLERSPDLPRGIEDCLDHLRDHLRNCEDLIKNSGQFIEFLQARDEHTRLVQLRDELIHAVSQAQFSLTTTHYQLSQQEFRRARRNSSNLDDGVFIGSQATPPVQIQAEAVTADVREDKLLRVVWDDNENDPCNVTGYELEYDEAHELTVRLNKTTLGQYKQSDKHFQVTLGKPKVHPGGVYSIRVRALNGSGPGEWSEPIVCEFPQPPPTPSAPTVHSVHLEADDKDTDKVRAVIVVSTPPDSENIAVCTVWVYPPYNSQSGESSQPPDEHIMSTIVEESSSLQSSTASRVHSKQLTTQVEVHESKGAEAEQTELPDERAGPLDDNGPSEIQPAEPLHGNESPEIQPAIQPAEPLDVNGPPEMQPAIQPAEPLDGNESPEIQPAEPLDSNEPPEIQPAEPLDGYGPPEMQPAIQPAEPLDSNEPPEIQPAEPLDGNEPPEIQPAIQPAEPLDGNEPPEIQPAEPLDVNGPPEIQPEIQPAEPLDSNGPPEIQPAIQPAEPLDGNGPLEIPPAERLDGSGPPEMQPAIQPAEPLDSNEPPEIQPAERLAGSGPPAEQAKGMDRQRAEQKEEKPKVCRWSREEIDIKNSSKVQSEGANLRITLSDFTKGKQYSFRATMRNQDGHTSIPSSIVTLPSGELLPGSPTAFEVTADYSHNTVVLTWGSPRFNNWAAQKYQVQVRTRTGTWRAACVSTTTGECTISKLHSRTEYFFRVCSVTESGRKSPYSREVSRKTKPHPVRRGLQATSITLFTSLTAPITVPIAHITLGLDQVDRYYRKQDNVTEEEEKERKAYAAFAAAATVLTLPFCFVLSPVLGPAYGYALAEYVED